MDAPRVLEETLKAFNLCGARERADRIRRLLRIGPEIEPPTVLPGPVAPRMSSQTGCLLKRYSAFEIPSRSPKQFLKDPSHGEHGRPGIDSSPKRDLPHFAAGLSRFLDDRNRHSTCRQGNRRGQPARASADDDNPVLGHAGTFPTSYGRVPWSGVPGVWSP